MEPRRVVIELRPAEYEALERACKGRCISAPELALPKVGSAKAARWLTQCRIAPSKTVGGLSDRQRHELIGFFRS